MINVFTKGGKGKGSLPAVVEEATCPGGPNCSGLSVVADDEDF